MTASKVKSCDFCIPDLNLKAIFASCDWFTHLSDLGLMFIVPVMKSGRQANLSEVAFIGSFKLMLLLEITCCSFFLCARHLTYLVPSKCFLAIAWNLPFRSVVGKRPPSPAWQSQVGPRPLDRLFRDRPPSQRRFLATMKRHPNHYLWKRKQIL